jgi:hypothetical protein
MERTLPVTEPDTPATWDQCFALFHQLWGEAAVGVYHKRAWAALSDALYERAEQAGYRRAALNSELPGPAQFRGLK